MEDNLGNSMLKRFFFGKTEIGEDVEKIVFQVEI